MPGKRFIRVSQPIMTREGGKRHFKHSLSGPCRKAETAFCLLHAGCEATDLDDYRRKFWSYGLNGF